MPTFYSMVNEIGNRKRILEMCKFRIRIFWMCKFRFRIVHWIDPHSILQLCLSVLMQQNKVQWTVLIMLQICNRTKVYQRGRMLRRLDRSGCYLFFRWRMVHTSDALLKKRLLTLNVILQSWHEGPYGRVMAQEEWLYTMMPPFHGIGTIGDALNFSGVLIPRCSLLLPASLYPSLPRFHHSFHHCHLHRSLQTRLL